jgi:dipeptidyl aminopeptidase/acylaminoacyl peptidase
MGIPCLKWTAGCPIHAPLPSFRGMAAGKTAVMLADCIPPENPTMTRITVALLGALLSLLALPAHAITLDQAMANPDWIGPAVESPYWSIDGKTIYYSVKRDGSSIRDLHRVDVESGKDVIVDPAMMASADGPDAVFSTDRQRAAFVRNGDVFVREVASGALRQITRSAETEKSLQFSSDDRAIQFRIDNQWFVHDLASGVTAPAAMVLTEKDPEDKKPDDLADLQLRLFSTLRDIKADREAKKENDEAFRKGDPTRAPKPFYLGTELTIDGSALAPDGRHLLIVTHEKSRDEGKIAKLQHYVTESGYEEQEDERVRVGRNSPAPNSLWLLDLLAHTQEKLSLADLPGIKDDPLAKVRDENRKAGLIKDEEKKPDAKTRAERGITVAEMIWNRDGSQAALQVRAIDNKDRWIATVDFKKNRLLNQHRLNDPAWINWSFNEFGWNADKQTLWYLSEETGYSQLYTKRPGQKAKALTSGKFEISNPQLSADGRWYYVLSNKEAPYAYDVYRVAASGGELQRITALRGMEEFALSPQGNQLALQQSSAYVPAQLAVVAAQGGESRALTDTRKPEYKALQWPRLDIVEVPSTHVDRPLFAKLYKPADFDASKKHPAVLFVHGAGYTQNVHQNYPYYFREQMFHNLLTSKGYVVLDMDYRASKGYGRDWRTAIYRQMGHPELEDLIDGVNWLVANQAVDSKRVGVYGGSYGGFMSLMAMFRAPEVFAAGAALRPVTDWTSYNHEYTSNILNTPQDDPLAYQRSSPIEFAGGLKGGLLIAHGMIDDNVLFQDSVRLYQRLIELRKDDFELSGYPLERHGFVHSDSWYDEYRRILKLFETHLN